MDSLPAPSVTKKAQTLTGESQLRQFGQFLSAHDTLLGDLLADDARTNRYRNTAPPTPGQCAPCALHIDRHEDVTHFQLANTNNTILNKIVCVFAELCTESRRLRRLADEQQLRFLFVDEALLRPTDDDDVGGSASRIQTTDPQQPQQQLIVRLSEQLQFLCEIQYMVQRCLVVGTEVLRQMGAYFGSSTPFVHNATASNPPVQLQVVFHRLADLATIFVIFDHILPASNVHEHWPAFAAAVDSMYDNRDQLPGNAYAAHDIAGLCNVLADMERQLFAGDLFQTFCGALQSVRQSLAARAAGTLSQHCEAYLRAQLHRLERTAGGTAGGQPTVLLNDFAEGRDIVRVNVMAVLMHGVFGRLDVPLAQRIFELNTRHCGVTLLEHFQWLPEEFFAKHVRYAPKSSGTKALTKYVTDAVRLRHDTMRSKYAEPRMTVLVQTLSARVMMWLLQMREAAARVERPEVTTAMLQARAVLVMEGVKLMGEISYAVKLITNVHLQLGTVMARQTLANVCRLLELYKCVHAAYAFEQRAFVVDAVRTVGQHLSYEALTVIQQTIERKSLSTAAVGSSAYNERDIDLLSALQLSERCLLGPATAQRILIARLALSIADPTAIFSADQLDIVSDRLGRIEALLELDQQLRRQCDTTFVYWHQTILAGFVKQVQSQAHPTDGGKPAKHAFPSPVNGVQFLARINAVTTKTESPYSVDVSGLFRTHFLARLCSHIENNLRLFIHTYMHDTPATAAAAAPSVLNAAAFHKAEAAQSADLLGLVAVRPLPLRDHHFVFRNHIEHYLSRTFYNLTAVSLSDGRTYGEMRSFARIKYGLSIVEDQLPAETIEQGLDVLDLMRFMDDFVTKFVYDMNSQVFIQATSGNQFLNTVTVAHVVNSLRTHGIGIVNTAINGGYKLLCQKMPLVSKFLYTDRIKSALSKCARHFVEHKERSNERFSFELARMFVKNAPRLTGAGEPAFGDFLATVTQIGNIMGYVRLVRSAGIRCVSRACVFLPTKADSAFPLAERAVDSKLSEVTCDAAWNVKVNIANLSKDFVHKPDYFKSFLQAFNDIIRDPKNGHLRHFHVVLPALTVLFVEALVRSKEYKHKSTDTERLVFTDDGFAMGVAYILVVLGQVDAFWTLDWFESVRIKYATELAELEAKRAALTSSFEDEKLRQTLLLTSKRIDTFADEFELLRCNLRCALRFFQ